jgi:riboflavin transporter FmnP
MSEEKQAFMARRSQLTLQIVGAAIFGALSLVMSVTIVPFLPRTPEGLAYFDPISIIWVTCFLIFGPYAGILCCIIGTITLFPFDPFTPIGPLMKFAATFSLIIVPITLLKLYKKVEGVKQSEKLKNRKNYVIYGTLGAVFRIVVMIVLNIIVYLNFYGGTAGLEAWLIAVILINALTSIWDLLFPYLIVFGGKLDEKFEIW